MIGNRGIDQDVQSTVDAYRGNPNALAQKYQQNQQLIDLLALQKLKSEKESVARDMQLKMGGQQMPTVAEKLEGEVLDLTKNEIAQQSTGAMQQQAQQKQQAMKGLVDQQTQPQPMMGGVAGLPAPNMAPKAMAAGGIVAFSGEDGSYVDPLAEASGMSEEALAQDRERVERIQAQREAERDALQQRFLRQAGAPQARPDPANTTAPPVATAPPQQQRPPLQGQPGQGAPRGAAPQGQAGIAGIDPRAIAMRDEIAKYVGFTPEERARREGAMADREKFDKERYSPQQQQNEALTRFLLGGAGRSGIGSIMAGAGAASENYKSSMRDSDRARMTDRQKQMDELISADVGTRKFSFEQGLESAAKYAQIAAQRANTALGQKQLSQNEAYRNLSAVEGDYNKAKEIAQKGYNEEMKRIGIFPGTKPTPEQAQALKIAQTQLQLQLTNISERLDPVVSRLRSAAGVPVTGFTFMGKESATKE